MTGRAAHKLKLKNQKKRRHLDPSDESMMDGHVIEKVVEKTATGHVPHKGGRSRGGDKQSKF